MYKRQVLSLAAGLAAPQLEKLLTPYSQTLPAEGVSDYHLALWHGVNTALLLTLLVFAVGTALFVAQRWVNRLRFEHPPLGNADRIYDATLRGMDALSMRLTGATQRGSLPLTQRCATKSAVPTAKTSSVSSSAVLTPCHSARW